MKSISLEISNSIEDCDKGYTEIRCVVDGHSITEFFRIFLTRLDELVAYVSEDVVLKDTELVNRSGVVVSSLIREVGLSYLTIRIMGSVVKPVKDKGPYQCHLQGYDSHHGFIAEISTLEMLNITGNVTLRLYIVCLESKNKEVFDSNSSMHIENIRITKQ